MDGHRIWSTDSAVDDGVVARRGALGGEELERLASVVVFEFALPWPSRLLGGFGHGGSSSSIFCLELCQ